MTARNFITEPGIQFLRSASGSVERTVSDKLDEFVSVKDFGAVGDGVTDDFTSIRSAINYVLDNGGTLYFPPGEYRITNGYANSSVTSQKSVRFLGDDAVINVDTTAFRNFAFFLQCSGVALSSVIFEGLTFKCNNKVATGIRVSKLPDVADYIGFIGIYRCKVTDCFQDTSISTSAQAIVAGGAELVEIKGNRIINVSRNKNPGVCQGIVATGNLNTKISDNYIKNVNFGTGDKVDADGIVYFNDNNLSFYSRDNALIENNTIIDCAGRFVKLQTGAGLCHVFSNYFKLEGSLELIQNFRGIDSQTGASLIESNKFEIGDQWTGGGSAQIIQLQAVYAENVEYANELVEQIAINNTIKYKKATPYCFLLGTPRADSSTHTHYKIINNLVQGTQNPGGSSTSNLIPRFIDTPGPLWPAPSGISSTLVWDIRDNTAACFNWVNFRGGGEVDYTDKWHYYFVNNTKTPYNHVTPLWASGNIYTSTFKISGNSLGSVDCPFDFQKILPGSSFTNGPGPRLNGPAEYENSAVRRDGSIGYTVYNASGIYVSASASGWSSLIS